MNTNVYTLELYKFDSCLRHLAPWSKSTTTCTRYNRAVKLCLVRKKWINKWIVHNNETTLPANKSCMKMIDWLLHTFLEQEKCFIIRFYYSHISLVFFVMSEYMLEKITLNLATIITTRELIERISNESFSIFYDSTMLFILDFQLLTAKQLLTFVSRSW